MALVVVVAVCPVPSADWRRALGTAAAKMAALASGRPPLPPRSKSERSAARCPVSFVPVFGIGYRVPDAGIVRTSPVAQRADEMPKTETKTDGSTQQKIGYSVSNF